MDLRREIQEDLIDARLLDFLQVRREASLDTRQDLARFQPVRVERHLMPRHVRERIGVVCPFLIALFPRRYMLHDRVRAEFLRFVRSEVPCHPELAGRVVDRDDGLPVIYGSVCILEYFGITEVLPLLHGERLVLWHAQAHHLALRVERIEVDVGDDAEGTGRGG